jgi:hypothetical protein
MQWLPQQRQLLLMICSLENKKKSIFIQSIKFVLQVSSLVSPALLLLLLLFCCIHLTFFLIIEYLQQNSLILYQRSFYEKV